MGGAVSATRMELLRLRRRLGLAQRGHHLLKGKQDELLRRFLLLLEEYMGKRHSLHGAVGELGRRTREVRSEVSAETVGTASWPPPPGAEISVRKRSILNLQVDAYELHPSREKGAGGVTDLPPSWDELTLLWREAAPLLVEVAEGEKVLLDLAGEIERTRRRVNALEHNLIPDLEEGIRTITFKLAETELGNLTRLMRIKDLVRGG